MIIYKIYHKDYEHKKCELIGVLHERRRDLRGISHLESGFKFAKLAFGNLVNDKQVIIVVPKELKQGKEHLLPQRLTAIRGKGLLRNVGHQNAKVTSNP